MVLIPWRCYEGLSCFSRQMSELFGRFFGREWENFCVGEPLISGLRVIEGEKEVHVLVGAEGFEVGDLEVSVEGTWLLIKGTRRPGLGDAARVGRDAREVLAERIQLRGQFDIDKVEARFREGLLEVVLPYARGNRSAVRITVE